MLKQIVEMAKNMMNPYDGSDRDDEFLSDRIKNEDAAMEAFVSALKTYECEFHPSADQSTGQVMVNIVSIHKNPKDEQDCTKYIYNILENYQVKFFAIFYENGNFKVYLKSTW